ncbi:MAG: dihydrodipicolinate synthase family protein [Herbaspirillum sp.]
MSAMMPLMDFLEESGKFVQSIKYGCELMGLKHGKARAPLQWLSEAQQNQLKRITSALKAEVANVVAGRA